MPGCSSGCPAADEFKTSQKDNMKKSVVKIQLYLVSLETLLVFRWKSRHEVTAFFIGILEMVLYSSFQIKFSIFLLGRTNIANLSEARSTPVTQILKTNSFTVILRHKTVEPPDVFPSSIVLKTIKSPHHHCC
jgi:hypothetical protein